MGHDLVAHNRRFTILIARSYDQVHSEIINPTEQARIEAAIAQPVSAIRTAGSERAFLDFGAGTGNLTHHMLTYAARVIAADISMVSLLELRKKHPRTAKLDLLELKALTWQRFRTTRSTYWALTQFCIMSPSILRSFGSFAEW
jgi:2-polyprenyl-3-methyl-5-hydroxy-6-metoxy-1,4-benzoquinol methylase